MHALLSQLVVALLTALAPLLLSGQVRLDLKQRIGLIAIMLVAAYFIVLAVKSRAPGGSTDLTRWSTTSGMLTPIARSA